MAAKRKGTVIKGKPKATGSPKFGEKNIERIMKARKPKKGKK